MRAVTVPGTSALTDASWVCVAPLLPADAWARVSAGDGAQGPRWYDWACLALPYVAAPGWAHWLLVRRSASRPAERAYYRVHAPADTAPEAMVRAAGRLALRRTSSQCAQPGAAT